MLLATGRGMRTENWDLLERMLSESAHAFGSIDGVQLMVPIVGSAPLSVLSQFPALGRSTAVVGRRNATSAAVCGSRDGG